jgi:hypothetical protein
MREHKHLAVKLIAVLSFLTFAFSSCKDDKTIDLNDCILNAPSYDNGIKKIIDVNCSGLSCHTSNLETFDFTTYGGVKEATGSIYNRITRNIKDPLFMPRQPTSPLDPCDLEKLKVWINAGAPRN